MQSILKYSFILLLSFTLSHASYSRHFVTQVQTKLTELGFAPGFIDGKMGPDTRAAIKAFQKSIGKRPTGRLSKTLLWQLKNAQNSCTAGFSQEMEELNGIKSPD